VCRGHRAYALCLGDALPLHLRRRRCRQPAERATYVSTGRKPCVRRCPLLLLDRRLPCPSPSGPQGPAYVAAGVSPPEVGHPPSPARKTPLSHALVLSAGRGAGGEGPSHLSDKCQLPDRTRQHRRAMLSPWRGGMAGGDALRSPLSAARRRGWFARRAARSGRPLYTPAPRVKRCPQEVIPEIERTIQDGIHPLGRGGESSPCIRGALGLAASRSPRPRGRRSLPAAQGSLSVRGQWAGTRGGERCPCIRGAFRLAASRSPGPRGRRLLPSGAGRPVSPGCGL
jgi:hypothetical protein